MNHLEQMSALQQECADCRRCSLADTRTNLVFGDGNPDAKIMLIGEAPENRKISPVFPSLDEEDSFWIRCWTSSIWTAANIIFATSSNAVPRVTGIR